jgi:hypothetical protein
MFKSSICCIATLLFLASNIAVITLSWVIMRNTVNPLDPLSVHNTVASELGEDWEKLPFVNLTVVSQSTIPAKDCPIGWEPLFKRTWAGTQRGCLINQGTANQTVVDYESYAMMTRSKANLTCDLEILA